MFNNLQEIISKIKFNNNGLVPAITQEATTKKILMMAWMSKESLEKTVNSGLVTYFSRSRNEIWQKGATSGNYQKVVKIEADCDFDCLLITVEQVGNACHTGEYSCFFNQI
ncbi:MAG: phosphoribosyl-AMP cyclohydrolase [Rickettsiales bacterium]|nr:phosphoribosyl-AMP cyclohydrolase [Rickettsiales bacterium]